MHENNNEGLQDYISEQQLDVFNAQIDAIIGREEIHTLLSDWDFLSEIDGLGKFYSKLRDTSLTDTIEVQCQFLSQFFQTNDQNVGKNELSEMQDIFIKNEYTDFINSYPKIFKFADKDKFYEAILMGHIGSRLNLSDNQEYRKKVIDTYYEILIKYQDFAKNHITSNDRYQYTINTPAVYRQYVELEKNHNIHCAKLENIRVGFIPDVIVEIIYQLVPGVKQLRQDGIDDYTYETILSDYFIGKIKTISIILNQFSRIQVTDFNGQSALQKYIDTISFIKSNLEIPESMAVEFDKYIDYFNNYWGGSSEGSDNSGCYIATMAYGSYEHPQVLELRKFRDDFLAKTIAGRMFIKTYYFISPKLIELLKNEKSVNTLIHKSLNQFIKIIK